MFKRTDESVFKQVFEDLLEGVKAKKSIAFDAGVSRDYVSIVINRFPLFFGLRREYKSKD